MKAILLNLIFVAVLIPIKAWAGFIDYPTVKLQALDKSTARTITFEAKVGSTIEYGSVFIKVKACRKSEPLDKPESASFIQVWEVPINSDKSEWIFSGWMFASSPALSAMNHPVYDVWVLDCIDKDGVSQKAMAGTPDEEEGVTPEKTEEAEATKEDAMTVEMDGEAAAAASRQKKTIDDVVDDAAEDEEEVVFEEVETDQEVTFERDSEEISPQNIEITQ